VALLNEQVAALRTQLGSLQGLLDDAAERDRRRRCRSRRWARSSTPRWRNWPQQSALADSETARAELEAAEAARLAAEAQELERYRSEFFGRLRELLEGREGVRIDGDRFVFSSEVLFDVGSADLAPEGLAQIENVAALLSEVADDIPDNIDWIIRVDGHTDDQQIGAGGAFRQQLGTEPGAGSVGGALHVRRAGHPAVTAGRDRVRGVPPGGERTRHRRAGRRTGGSS
jgi:chemotaxis protein MotB